MKRKNFIRTISTGIAAGLFLPDISLALPPKRTFIPKRKQEDFSCMWWKDGVRSTQKVFNVLSGYYGLSFDYDRLSLMRLGSNSQLINETDIFPKGNNLIDALDEVTMESFIENDGQRILLKGAGDIEDCQLVESGTYFQRRWMPSLNFDAHGIPADKMQSGLELSIWPSSFIFSLRILSTKEWVNAVIGLSFSFPEKCVVQRSGSQIICRYPTGKGFVLSFPGDEYNLEVENTKITVSQKHPQWRSDELRAVSISFKAINDTEQTTELTNNPFTIHAKQLTPDQRRLEVSYDPVCGWHLIDLPEDSDKFEADVTDLSLISIKNNSSYPQTLQLNFCKKQKINGISGLCSVLSDSKGFPLGIPVQVSKDWHDRPARFSGQWYHGICVLQMKAGEEISLIHHLVHAYWKNLPAVSMSQLCLVGWGKNQLWLQSAIGSWGETITFEPDQTHGRGLVLDCRPLAVWGMGDKPDIKWTWTHNVGGADFLVYYDENNKRQWPSRAKTQITRYGPLLSEVMTDTETDDHKIAMRCTLGVHGTDDYVRGIYNFRIDIKESVRFTRFVIFQCGGDEYNYSTEQKMAYGNERGLSREWNTQWGGNLYRTGLMPLTGPSPWISLHEAVKLTNEGGAIANRGIIIRRWKAMINGQEVNPCIAERGAVVSGENTSLIDILLPDSINELQPGDFIEGQIEHLILPQYASDYFGINKNLSAALKQSANTWKMIYRDVLLNDPEVDVTHGQLLSSRPVKIAFEKQPLLINITKGLAWQPVTIVNIDNHNGFVLEENNNGKWAIVSKDHGWQTDINAATGMLEITFLLDLDQPGDKPKTRKFRFTLTPGKNL